MLNMKNPTVGGAAGFDKTSLPDGIDDPSAPKIAPAQSDFLLEAIKTLAAEEIRAGTLENIPLTLAASGWRSTAALLVHECADAGDFLNAERNRQIAREQFIEANDVFRQFMEARGAEARAKAFAEAFQ
jgi:hypothetical protein